MRIICLLDFNNPKICLSKAFKKNWLERPTTSLAENNLEQSWCRAVSRAKNHTATQMGEPLIQRIVSERNEIGAGVVGITIHDQGPGTVSITSTEAKKRLPLILTAVLTSPEYFGQFG